MKNQRSEVRGQGSAKRRKRRGFTLLEIMIVVGIIVILVSIVLAVGGALAGNQNVRRTEATMEILDKALSEWELLMRRQLSWGIDGQMPDGTPNPRANYDIQEDTMHIFLISDMLDDVGVSSDLRTILAQIDSAHYVRYEYDGPGGRPSPVDPSAWILEGNLTPFQATEPDPNVAQWATDAANWYGKHTALDAWDRPIRIIHPGRLRDPNDLITGPADEDGTVRTPLEDVYGIAVNAKPYFVSSGPDGRFGSLATSATQAQQEAARDNIYTYEVHEP